MTPDIYEDEQTSAAEQDIGTRRAFGRLVPFLKEHKLGLFIALLLLAGSTGLSLVWPKLLQQGLDVHLANDDYRGLLWIAAAIGAIQIATVLTQYLMRVRLETIGQDIMLRLKRKLYHHILSLDVSFFDRNPVGRLLARVESDTESLRLMFTTTVVLVLGDAILIIGIYSILFWTHWKMALALFIWIPVIAAMIWYFHRKTSDRFLNVRKRMAEVTASLTEFLHGISIVQIFHRGDWARRKMYEMNRMKFTEDRYVNIAVILFFNTIFYFEYVKIGLVLIIGPIIGMTFGTILMFVMYIWRSFEPIWRTSEQLSNFQKAVAGSKRIFALLSEQPRVSTPENPVEWHGLAESIRFEDVWFSYTDDDNYALKNATFEIKKGQRVALVGVTGGGKSTVISLLLRFYDPQKGRITVDGIDIRDIDLAVLRSRFALVLQDIHLFPGTVRDNISLEADGVDEDRVESAARTVEADAFVSSLPDGFDTEVSEKGANFSRGERQLLSFARALAAEPDVLVLDEATSSVDPETERIIQHSMKKLMTDRTSLIIAHRLSTILDVDQILVIRRGEIIERGSHPELLLANGYYSKLFHLQFKPKNGVAANAG